MFKLKKQLYLLKLVSFIFLGLLIFKNNNFLYAFPGIDLDARMMQLTEERDNLLQQLHNNFNNLNLDNATRLIRMQNITASLDRVLEQINSINQQLILRDQFQQQRTNSTLNQQNNNERN
ncbi:effector protein [Candidatus Phytoplasma ziziphi]|uniref:Effector protein n=1 Tax=Ziziphus jujuba witches'-broom phytoplasma TaxID=135727 RepID=A0A660HME0_ZIZJU|nr:SVM family protein [Candidatus Phytoplasma ziziphi]AYJ01200.1 effector protein [Candidatus Phytoplasma ziziphi]